MSLSALQTIATVHSLLAWAAVVSTALAAWLAWTRRLTIPIAALATSLLTVTTALGLLLHEPYQRRLRQRIFVQSPRIGWLFERKEHLAFGAILLAICALTVLIVFHLRAQRRPPDAIATDLRKAVVRAYTTSTLLATAAALASAIVAHHWSF